MKLISKRTALLLISSFLFVESSFATDGYFLTGYGAKQQGLGGAGVAFPLDSLASATNPAGLVRVGNRFDIGLTLFRPIRSTTITGNQLPPGYPNINGTYNATRVSSFFLPDLGYSHLLRPNLAVGVAIYGNGGMNTSYTTPILLLGNTRGGVDLDQVIAAPTIAYKLGAHHSFGLGVNLAYQRFAAEGIQNFASPNYSANPTAVTNTGHSNSYGAGVHIGWLGELSHGINLGATYQTKTYATKFTRYSGLFAEQGGFDIPASFSGGIALKLHPRATLLFDTQRILYSQVKSIANSGSNQALLGSDNGPGFGWHNITVIKTGLAFTVNPALSLRGGYNHATSPFDNTQTFFNILAPAVVQDHLHLGATWNLHSGREINLAYVHAFQNTMNGVNSIAPTAGGGNANLSMYQNSFQIGFGWNRNK
jgi:long-chain fatty acid transport protein